MDLKLPIKIVDELSDDEVHAGIGIESKAVRSELVHDDAAERISEQMVDQVGATLVQTAPGGNLRGRGDYGINPCARAAVHDEGVGGNGGVGDGDGGGDAVGG